MLSNTAYSITDSARTRQNQLPNSCPLFTRRLNASYWDQWLCGHHSSRPPMTLFTRFPCYFYITMKTLSDSLRSHASVFHCVIIMTEAAIPGHASYWRANTYAEWRITWTNVVTLTDRIQTKLQRSRHKKSNHPDFAWQKNLLTLFLSVGIKHFAKTSSTARFKNNSHQIHEKLP